MLHLKTISLSFLALLLSPVLASAQAVHQSGLVCESSLIDTGQSPVIITYSRTETAQRPKGKKESVYWLRLQNNTKCSLEILAAESVSQLLNSPRAIRNEAGQFVKNDEGGLKIERHIALQNNDVVPIIYHIHNSKQKTIGAENYEDCVLLTPEIPSGVTVTFCVASPKFKKDHSLSVFFVYKGEPHTNNNGVLPRKAFFTFDELPQLASTQKRQ